MTRRRNNQVEISVNTLNFGDSIRFGVNEVKFQEQFKSGTNNESLLEI